MDLFNKNGNDSFDQKRAADTPQLQENQVSFLISTVAALAEKVDQLHQKIDTLDSKMQTLITQVDKAAKKPDDYLGKACAQQIDSSAPKDNHLNPDTAMKKDDKKRSLNGKPAPLMLHKSITHQSAPETFNDCPNLLSA